MDTSPKILHYYGPLLAAHSSIVRADLVLLSLVDCNQFDRQVHNHMTRNSQLVGMKVQNPGESLPYPECLTVCLCIYRGWRVDNEYNPIAHSK